MAKRSRNKPARRREAYPEDGASQEFSLEDILSEYRLTERGKTPPREPERSAELLSMEPETDGVLTAQVTEPAAENGTPDGSGPAPWEDEAEEPELAEPMPEEDILDEMYAPEELKPWVDPEAEDTPERASRAAAPVREKPKATEEAIPADVDPEETPADGNPEEALTDEGYADDADFYAAEVEQTTGEKAETGEETAFSGTPAPARRSAAGPLPSVWEKLTGFLAVAAVKREQRRRQSPPEPENKDKEMPPDKAARYYASQMPALKLRSYAALGVCALLTWLTIGSGLGAGLPGDLATDNRLAAMVLLVGQTTVLLLALDVFTAGIMSMVRGRPGAESLLTAASLASVIDTAAVIITKNDFRGIPFGAVTSLGLFFALRGAWHYAKSCHDTFLTVFRCSDPVVLSREELPEREDTVILASRRDTAGFIRRSEEPGETELLSSLSAAPMLLISAALSLAAAVGSGDVGAFFHVFALMTALCAGFGWLFSYQYLFSAVADRLMKRGCALAGWSGARDMGSGRLVIRDTDIFPEDTVEITGIRLLDKSRAQYIIACTGTMLSTAGTGTARVFTELMRRHKAAMQTLEDFSVGEGGCKAVIQYQEVRVGSLGYMYLSGVKVPDKLKSDDAVYTAIDGELFGVFLFRYRPIGSVQKALRSLRRKYRKPLFLARDFNIDPHMIRSAFGVSTEGFDFPPFPERYRLSAALAEGSNPVSGAAGKEGLDLMEDLSESGARFYLLGRICAWSALGSAVLGMVLMFVPCWLGNWSMASAWLVLVYSLLWLLPAFISRLLLRK